MVKTATRAVLVGCGGMSRAWLDAASEHEDVEVVGLVDIDKRNARWRAEEFRLENALIGDNLKSMLREMEPDVVFDVTIPEAHTEVATTALKHGCTCSARSRWPIRWPRRAGHCARRKRPARFTR